MESPPASHPATRFSIRAELVPGVHNGLTYRGLPGQQHLTRWGGR